MHTDNVHIIAVTLNLIPKIVKKNNIPEIADLLRYWTMLEMFGDICRKYDPVYEALSDRAVDGYY